MFKKRFIFDVQFRVTTGTQLAVFAHYNIAHRKFDELLRKHAGTKRKKILVDVMPFDEDEVMLVEVENNDGFHVTGHYPILAGNDMFGSALYVVETQSISGRTLTCMSERCLAGTFFGRHEEQDARGLRLKVLVLRHDPSDLVFHCPSNIGVGNTMDPTGPLRWRKFWPVEDLETRTFISHPLCMGEQLVRPLKALKSYLNSCAEAMRMKFFAIFHSMTDDGIKCVAGERSSPPSIHILRNCMHINRGNRSSLGWRISGQ